jgi:23S rRNA pseudouridine1911/1915/1917 synthase
MKYLLQDRWNDIVTIREYIAVVEGKLKDKGGTIKSWLKETKTQLVYSSHKSGDGDEAITHYQVIKENDKYSLLDIRIDTGRKNQIRVHMHDLGHSVAGDKKYYATTNPLKRLGLHASILEFKHPITNKIMHFESKTPIKFINLFNK